MRARPAAPGAGGARGFTLLEMVLVLVLAGILAALVAPTVSGSLESARLRAGAGEVRATFNLARTLAASAGAGRFVSFDLERGEYGIAGEERRRLLPRGIRILSLRVGNDFAESGRPPGGDGLPAVRFFPDGAADEATVVLASDGGGRLAVVVDPLTGLAEAER